MPPSETKTLSQTVEVSPNSDRIETVVYQYTGIEKLLEWVGFGCLLFAVWIWREQIGINQIAGVIGAPPVTQEKAGTPSKPPEEAASPPAFDLSTIDSEIEEEETRRRLELIMEMFNDLHSISIHHVSKKLGVSTNSAKKYLYLLKKHGQIRMDGFPNHTIYTAAKSLENRILDTIKHRLSEKYEMLTERRFIQIRRRYEVDSLLVTGKCTFIVEAKVLRSTNLVERLDDWILRLLRVAKEFRNDKISCVLALACVEEADSQLVKQQIATMTFDSWDTPLEVFVLSESELLD